VVDDHTHCPCNGVWLHHSCHQYVHAHPVEARRLGLIVSRYEENPYVVPVEAAWGTRYHSCGGEVTYV